MKKRKKRTLLKILKDTVKKYKALYTYYFSKEPVSLTKEIIMEYNTTRCGIHHPVLCHAPYTNIFFGYDGKIGVCCYNRTHLIGTYPETSIKAACAGKPLQSLRKKIERVDLLSGCYGCRVQWQEKAYKTVLAKNYDHYSMGSPFPKCMEFELSNRCNLQCVMCSEENSSFIARERLGQEERLKPYDDKFVSELEAFIPHLQSAKFLGGEPFLISIYYKIWDKIIQLNPACEILVQTNGTILNDKIKNLLSSGNFALNISMDSLNKESFEKIRVNADFESTYENLLYFIDFCKKNKRYFGITACFIQQNWKDIPQLINFCNEYQIPITFNRVWSPPKCAIWESSYALIDEILGYYRQQKFPENNEIEKANLQAFTDLVFLLENWKEQMKDLEESEEKNVDTPESELEEQIRDSILEAIKTKNISSKRRNEIMQKLDFFFQKFKGHPQYKMLLLKTLELPGEILQSQLMNNSFDRIEQQIKDIIT
ncbi:MAG: radical SAM protein [Bacteroidales bacterium]|jgi:uncharacterized Fe-S cluster-containing radical SAM superfamily protein|nr:radical SAM protein [Bacteroidales bacterium]